MNKILLLVMLALIVLLSITVTDQHKFGRVVKYDCRMSEIKPDYPAEVREACRHIRAEKNKQ
jgi:hypothetical protein